jgi:hypothetical protein
MKKLVFLISLMASCIAHSAVTIYQTVPFNNVKMHFNDTIIANYNFANNGDGHKDHLAIFCSDPSMTNVGRATWPYNGQIITQNIPIQLKVQDNITGTPADKAGAITIVDTQKKNENGDFIFMSCNFFG